MAPSSSTSIEAWVAPETGEICNGSEPPKQKSSKWLNRLLVPFAGLRGRKHAYAATSSPRSMASSVATSSAGGLRTAAVATTPHPVAVATSSSALACRADDSAACPENHVLAIADKPLSFERQLRDAFAASMPAPPAPWAALPALGTAAGYPAAHPPSSWSGKDSLPIELWDEELWDEENEAGSMLNAESDNLQPQLPAPHENCPASPISPSAAAYKPLLDPVVRPTSYRNRGKSSAEVLADQLGLSDELKPNTLRDFGALSFENAEKVRPAYISISSRPTTAGADSACTGTRTSTPACTSTSWRSEWTPGSRQLSETKVVASFQPLPNRSKPPPLPPLPSKPPQSGSVRGPALETASELQKHTGKDASSLQVPCSPAADDAALRRISLSANAKAAMPPPLPRRHADKTSIACGLQKSLAADSDKMDADVEVAASGFDESLRGDFSELALAWTCMEVA